MDNNEKGSLVVTVNTASGAIPIMGATVRIYRSDENGVVLEHSYRTDRSGRTPISEIATPPKALSQSPSDQVPYVDYIVDTDYEGYYSVENINVPIFPGVTSIQNVSLVPLSTRDVNNGYNNTIYNESSTGNL